LIAAERVEGEFELADFFDFDGTVVRNPFPYGRGSVTYMFWLAGFGG
jgi:hypothetical protein